MKKTMPASQLRRTYESEEFKIFTKEIPQHLKSIIGQQRAVRAMRFGLGNRAPGFNVYVASSDGDDKIEVIRHFLEESTGQDPIPPDWCYVNNFYDSYCPNALRLPQGKARELKDDIDQFINDAKIALTKTLESEAYAEEQTTIRQELARQQQLIFSDLTEKARKEGFWIKHTPMEVVVVPVKENNEPMQEDEFRNLSQEEREEILRKQREIRTLFQIAVRKSRELEKESAHELADLEQRAAMFAIEDLLEDLVKKYQAIEEIPEYLTQLKEDILSNLALFLEEEDGRNFGSAIVHKSLHQRYEVNVLVDNAELKNAPIIVELNPTYNNLFGKIERESIMGALVTNFTLIRPGALHFANGGYLILPVEEVLRSPFSWDTLKRALRNQRIEIEDPTEKLGFISAKSLKPEPISLQVQVILIGQPWLFHLLYQYDDDFKKLFKIKADFDPVMLASRENLREVCGHLDTIVKEEGMLPVSDAAMARIIEYGHRLAEHQDKITTELEEIVDILREAHFYAASEAAEKVSAAHIRKAVEEKKHRSDLIHEKIKELIANRTLIIELVGARIGQVNGLSVIDLGDITFGRPNRITASISLGHGGIVDIEREAEMGGPIHTKGVLILSGFLFDKFGKNKPLNLSVHLGFEQSYSGVEGDSASSAELYAILSRLSELPLAQGIAATGSVNQWGEIQAVGGINEKIEGFFEVCQQKGLTGDQGVIIPASNQVNLMLREEVVEAVSQGKFHLWVIDNVDEGIEILTGVPAGQMEWDEESADLSFTEGSVYDRVNRRLEQLAEIKKEYGPKVESESEE